MNRSKILTGLLMVALGSGCIVTPENRTDTPYGPGAIVTNDPPATGQTGVNGMAPPTPTGQLAPVAVITAPKRVSRDDAVLVSALQSSVGSGVGLTYAWSISGAALTNCGDASKLAEPAIELCSGQADGTVTVSLTVTNDAGTSTATAQILVEAGFTINAAGSADAGVGRPGGAIAIDGLSIDNKESSVPGLPKAFPADQVIEVGDYDGSGTIDEQDICRKAQGFPPGQNMIGSCDPQLTPTKYRAVHLRDPNNTQFTQDVTIDMSGFVNPNTGLKIVEVRAVNQLNPNDSTVSISNVERVVLEQSVAANGVTIDTGVISIYAAKLLDAGQGPGGGGGTISLRTSGATASQLSNFGDIVAIGGLRSVGSGNPGGNITVDAQRNVVLSGDINASGADNATNVGGGNITIIAQGSGGIGGKVELRHIRTINAGGGDSAGANPGANGNSIDIGQNMDANIVDLPNMVFTSRGGKTGTGAAAAVLGGTGGNVNIAAVRRVVVGSAGKIAKEVIATTGGQVLSATTGVASAGGNGGNVIIETTATDGEAGIYGVGGIIRTDGGSAEYTGTVPNGPPLGGTAGTITLRNDVNAAENTIFWTGDLEARGGNTRYLNASNAVVTGTVTPGSPNAISLNASAAKDATIFINGSVYARYGNGVGGTPCTLGSGVTLTARAGTGAANITFTGALDTSGGFTTADNPGVNEPNTVGMFLANAGVPSASNIAIELGGVSSTALNANQILAKAGKGESGNNGCTVTAAQWTPPGPAGPVLFNFTRIETSGSNATELGNGGTAGGAVIAIASGRPSRFELDIAEGIFAFGGDQELSGTSADAGGSAGSGNQVSVAIMPADEIHANVRGPIDTHGGNSGVPDMGFARTAGAGGAIGVVLGDASTRVVRGTFGVLNGPAGTALGSGLGWVAGGVNPAAPAGTVITTVLNPGAGLRGTAEVTFGEFNFAGGNGAGGSVVTAVNQVAGGRGRAVLATFLADGSLTIAGVKSYGGNAANNITGPFAQAAGLGGSWTFTSQITRNATVSLGAVDAHGGVSDDATGSLGGGGGEMLFNIPSPIMITAPTLNVSGGAGGPGGGMAGTAGSIKHDTTMGNSNFLVSIACTTATGVAGTGGAAPCIDKVFTCSTGQNICNTGDL